VKPFGIPTPKRVIISASGVDNRSSLLKEIKEDFFVYTIRLHARDYYFSLLLLWPGGRCRTQPNEAHGVFVRVRVGFRSRFVVDGLGFEFGFGFGVLSVEY
jgi:hypothetical protein